MGRGGSSGGRGGGGGGTGSGSNRQLKAEFKSLAAENNAISRAISEARQAGNVSAVRSLTARRTGVQRKMNRISDQMFRRERDRQRKEIGNAFGVLGRSLSKG